MLKALVLKARGNAKITLIVYLWDATKNFNRPKSGSLSLLNAKLKILSQIVNSTALGAILEVRK